MANERLHLTDVTKSFNGRKVIDIKDLKLGIHPIEGLIGPNGAGKTTLMGLITGRLPMDTGTIIYYPNVDGGAIDITKKRLDQVARMGLVKSNQVIVDFDSLSIRESLLLALTPPQHERFFHIFNEGRLEKEVEEQIAEYLDYFHFQNPEGHALSAGEKKLLDIIRCLVLKPSFLLMDEPTAGLPDDLTRKVMDLMKQKANEGMSILIVEHDLDLMWELCELVHFMAEGELLLQGTPDEVRQDRVVAEKYMGADHV